VEDKELILFDFDGVIIDGMDEYWHSSLLACKYYLNSKDICPNINVNSQTSNVFISLRPWIKYGWEMVIITHEIIKKNNPLDNQNKDNFLADYKKNCTEIIKKNSWDSENLQKYLDKARELQISDNFDKWISLHNPFIEVVKFIKYAKKNGYQIGIITTKKKLFTQKILKKIDINPDFLYGYESGSKTEIITNLINDFKIIGFLEDRLKTLLNIVNNSQTSNVPCYLADWGYLKEEDRIDLPKTIKLLTLNDLKNTLANFN
tara:strand:- start:29 stop:811 length:783 start_codon:yes stop_codon:yes gene_type:complete